MLLPTHLAITTIIAKGMNVSGINLWLAYIFGVGIDIDHLFVGFNRLKDKKFWKSDSTKCDHTWLHEPVGLLMVAIFSLLIKNWIPLIFYSIHFFIDQIILRAKNKPFLPFSKKEYTYGIIPSGSKIEWILAPFLLIGTIIYMIIWFR